jgi:hypothetical protein
MLVPDITDMNPKYYLNCYKNKGKGNLKWEKGKTQSLRSSEHYGQWEIRLI